MSDEINWREQEAISRERAMKRVRELINEVSSESSQWVRERKEEYLRNELDKYNAALISLRIGYAKALRLAKAKEQADFEAALETLTIGKILAKILKLKKSLAMWMTEREKKDISPEMIQKAREYPMWKLFGAKVNQRVACQFHAGEDRNFILSDRGTGHCFVCNRTYNAIDYLVMVEGNSFLDAVKRLVG